MPCRAGLVLRIFLDRELLAFSGCGPKRDCVQLVCQGPAVVEENRNIELDLDQAQPVEAKKVEGAWGLYEEAVQGQGRKRNDATGC